MVGQTASVLGVKVYGLRIGPARGPQVLKCVIGTTNIDTLDERMLIPLTTSQYSVKGDYEGVRLLGTVNMADPARLNLERSTQRARISA